MLMLCGSDFMQLEIKVTANSRRDEIIEGIPLEVHVQAPPEKNKANLAVAKLLSRYFSKPVRIVSGLRGRKKIIEF